MKSVAILLFPSVLWSVLTQEPCDRLRADAESPAGLVGRYEVVGRYPNSSETYQGTASLTIVGENYAIQKTIEGTTKTGVAWVQVCGPDEIRSLRIQFSEGSRVLSQICSIGMDGDNYYRLSCRTGYDDRDSNRRLGIEALFQVPK